MSPEVHILDGAMGSELDRAGVDVSLPLWSARALVEAPDVVRAIHEAYLEAGADAITTNTFRTNRRALEKGGWGDRAGALVATAVRLAREACDHVRPHAPVLGSVAPLEECYDPSLAPDAATCRREHETTMGDLLEAGVDRLLLETLGTVREARAAAEAAERLAPGRWLISFCLRAEGPPGHLLDGEPLDDLLPELGGATAVGVNCVPAPATAPHVAFLRAHLPDDVAVMAYANVGHADAAGNWINTDAIQPQRYAEYAAEWIDAGATIVGGCCGTTPAHIVAVRNAVTPKRRSAET